MNNFKKHPIFTAVFALLLAVFAGGLVYSLVLVSQNNAAQKSVKSSRNRYNQAVSQDPGKENLELADKNLAILRERLDLLGKDLSSKSYEILKESPYKQGYALQQYMRSAVQGWTRAAEERGIEVPANFSYSFKKYVESDASPMADAAVPAIWKQFNILDYIVRQLWDSKAESPMRLLSIQREFLLPEQAAEAEKAAASKTRRTSKITASDDTFQIDKYITSRKEGSINAISFKISFTGYTESMRRFLNNLNSYDLMLVVRSVEVKPYVESFGAVSKSKKPAASAEVEEFFSESEDGKAAGEEKVVEPSREPVVSENLSEFTFVIEYVEVDAEKAPAKPAKPEGEDE